MKLRLDWYPKVTLLDHDRMIVDDGWRLMYSTDGANWFPVGKGPVPEKDSPEYKRAVEMALAEMPAREDHGHHEEEGVEESHPFPTVADHKPKRRTRKR
jgi:hypothetical protein